MKYITYKQIREHNPCATELRKVRRLFGKRNRIRVTVKLAEALAQRFDFEWLAKHTLIAPAWADYKRATAAALANYKRAKAAAWARAYISQS